ncbi:MAG: fimbrial protein [Kluyvera ascorbata]
MKKSRLTLAGGILMLLVNVTPVAAKTGACHAEGRFVADATGDWTQAQNVAQSFQELSPPLDSNAYQIDCTCGANDKVNVYYRVISILSQTSTQSGYYRLNSNLDIKTEVDDIPGATAITPLYTNLIKENGSYGISSTKGSVCQDDPAETRAAPVTIGANTRLTLYVTKPFLGELIIPDTHIASIQAGWSDTTTFPSLNTLEDIAELHISGRITVPQDCKINQGDIIQVDLGSIKTSRFATKNSMPDGYTPVSFEINYDCGDMSSIKNIMEMQINGEDTVGQYTLVGRRRASDNVADVGIEMEGNVKIPFQNGLIAIDPSGKGSATLKAWPVNLVGGMLAPGKIKGSATITVVVK